MTISTPTLARLRAIQRQSMVDTAYLRRAVQVSDGAGGSTEVATFLGPYPCRLGVSRLQRGEELIAGQLQGKVPWTVTLPAGTDVNLADDLNVGGTVVSGAFVDGRNFEILAIYSPTSFSTETACLCAEK